MIVAGNIYRDTEGNYQAYMGIGIVPKEVEVIVDRQKQSCHSYGLGEAHHIKEIRGEGTQVVPLFLTVYKNKEEQFVLAHNLSMGMLHTTDIKVTNRIIGNVKCSIKGYLESLRKDEEEASEHVIEAKAIVDWWKKLNIRIVGDYTSSINPKSLSNIVNNTFVCEDRW